MLFRSFLADLVEAEVPVVPTLPLHGNNTLAQVPGTKIWFCMFKRVGGRVPDEMNPEQLAIVGRLLARMHLCGEKNKADHRQRIDQVTYGENHLKYLLDSKTIPIDLSGRYQRAAEAIFVHAAPLFAKATYQRIHGDCHLGNLLWSDQGPFWVDFDDMLMGPVVQDIWLLTPGRDEYSLKNRQTLIEAYSTFRKFDSAELALIEPLRALR